MTLAQQIVDTIHDVCGYDINFINPEGRIYASTDPERSAPSMKSDGRQPGQEVRLK